MRRFSILGLFIFLFIHTSCEECTQCSYKYTNTSIVVTPNGEEVVVDTLTGYILDEDGLPWSEECIKENKGEVFTIEDAYEEESLETTLDDFTYSCQKQ